MQCARMLRQLLLLLPMATGSSDMPSAAPVARRLISVNGVGTCPAASHGLATLKGHICPVTKLSIPPVTMCVWPPARDHYISNGIIRQGTWLLPNDESLRQHMVYCFSAAGAARSALPLRCGAAVWASGARPGRSSAWMVASGTAFGGARRSPTSTAARRILLPAKTEQAHGTACGTSRASAAPPRRRYASRSDSPTCPCPRRPRAAAH